MITEEVSYLIVHTLVSFDKFYSKPHRYSFELARFFMKITCVRRIVNLHHRGIAWSPLKPTGRMKLLEV